MRIWFCMLGLRHLKRSIFMATNKIAVAVIHGMGSQGRDKQGINDISFSAELYKRLRDHLGASFFDHVGWREIFWADILQERQEDYVKYLGNKGARWMDARRFVMHNLADAASYRKTGDPRDLTYFQIHERVHKIIQRLEQITDGDTPLIILAHSLGRAHHVELYLRHDEGHAAVARYDRFSKAQDNGGFRDLWLQYPGVFVFVQTPRYQSN
jgi:hypothetical protein